MTLVSFKHNFIYLRTRKTASTSVEMFMQPACTAPGTPVVEKCEAIVSPYGIVGQRLGRERLNITAPDPELRDKWWSHHGAASLKKKLPRRFWKKALKFTTIRNPYNRMLSAFFWQPINRTEVQNSPEMIQKFRDAIHNRRFKNDRSIVFIRDKFQPDMVIRTEHLADDLTMLLSRLNLDMGDAPLPHAKDNRSRIQSPSPTEFYDDETAAIVREEFDWMFASGQYPDHPQ